MISERLNHQVNALIEKYRANGGGLDDLSQMLGVNLSTLWRYRSKGFTDPYSVYLIAKASGETEESAQALAKEIFVANGGNPDRPLRRRSHRAESFREQIREIVLEELSKATKAS